MADSWQNRIIGYKQVPVSDLLANPDNARRHPPNQRDALRGSLDTLGWVAPVLLNIRTGYLIDGHARVEELLTKDDNALIPVIEVDISESEEKQFLASFDWITQLATYDRDNLANLLQDVNTDNENVQAMLAGMAGEHGLYDTLEAMNTDGQYDSMLSDIDNANPKDYASLADRFVVPPFSILDARQGYWQSRKRAWLALGIQSEVGRGENLQGMSPANDEYMYNKKTYIQGKQAAAIGGSPLPLDRTMANGKSPARKSAQDLMRGEHVVGTSRKDADKRSNLNNAPKKPDWATGTGTGTENMASGTSIFDPVLCELAYSWFTPVEAHILDPFAGGSVRGIVASKLGRKYTGVDLRPEQIEANIAQGNEITPDNIPQWITGDSTEIDTLAPNDYDFVFTCPPYADLEIYSEDERDISNMPYPQFLETYRTIIKKSCAMLKDNRFAMVVVGDVRDKQGNYYNFVSDTIAAFIDSGLSLYNEAILVTAVGSLPIRAGKQFTSGRKLGKTHQNVLIFLKGDSKQAVEYCGDVDVYIPDDETDSDDSDDSEYGERLIVS